MLKQIKIFTLIFLLQFSTARSCEMVKLLRKHYKEIGIMGLGLGLLAWKLYSNSGSNNERVSSSSSSFGTSFSSGAASIGHEGASVSGDINVRGSITIGGRSVATSSFETIRGSGRLIRQSYDVKDFSQIEIGGSAEVILTQSDREFLVIETDDNIIPHIQVFNSEGKLKIGIKPNLYIQSTMRRYIIGFKKLDSLNLSGSLKVKMNKSTFDNLSMVSSGSVDLEAIIITKNLLITASGSTYLKLSGAANYQSISTSGSVIYDATSLECDDAHVTTKGSSRLKLNVRRKIDGAISGSSELIYKNSPTIYVHKTGSSSIKSIL